MARLPRIVIPSQPLHIMHRGNNRQMLFETEDDFIRLKEDLAHSLTKSNCQLHAYVVMGNHIHLLLTPQDKADLSVFMQSLSNRYVRYFNAVRNRTGTIWEGRFKSCLVDSDNYLFTVYKYIEMNTIKADMVSTLVDYPWSSYHHNALGKEDELITPHMLYTELAKTSIDRVKAYRRLFSELDITKQNDVITTTTQNGEVLGSEGFHTRIEKLLSRPTRLSSHGGDRKSQHYKRNQAG